MRVWLAHEISRLKFDYRLASDVVVYVFYVFYIATLEFELKYFQLDRIEVNKFLESPVVVLLTTQRKGGNFLILTETSRFPEQSNCCNIGSKTFSHQLYVKPRENKRGKI